MVFLEFRFCRLFVVFVVKFLLRLSAWTLKSTLDDAPVVKAAPAESGQVKKVATAVEEDTSDEPPKGARTEDRVKMNRMRLRIAQRLKDSQNTAASLTTFNEVDMSSIMDFRNKYKDAFLKKHGIKLGFMSAFAKASAHALTDEVSKNRSR